MSLYRKNDVTVGHHGIIRLLFSSMIDGTGGKQGPIRFQISGACGPASRTAPVSQLKIELAIITF